MKPNAALIAAALLLPLGACNKEPEVSATNATPAEVQKKVAEAGGTEVMVQPGRWEGAMTIHEMDMPGLPPQAKEQMKTQIGQARSFVSCVTEEDVKKQKAFFTGEEDDKSCKYDHFSLAGGKIAAAMKCDRGDAKMTMNMTGAYTPDTYRMEMASKAEGGGPMGAMTMKMTVEGKRVGACRGTNDEL